MVGREDTGALEAQIRGSRYAWEMRLISVNALIQLVQVKEKSDDIGTVRQIGELLKPFEYTKIDKIIRVIFSTTQSVETQKALALPFSWMKQNRFSLTMTERSERSYWHVPLITMPEKILAINLSKIGNKVSLSPFRFLLPG